MGQKYALSSDGMTASWLEWPPPQQDLVDGFAVGNEKVAGLFGVGFLEGNPSEMTWKGWFVEDGVEGDARNLSRQ